MASGSNGPDVVVLKGGIVLPVEALQLAWKLEDKGCRFRIEPADGSLVITPRELLTDADRVEIRRWLDDLKAIVQYQVPPGEEPQ